MPNQTLQRSGDQFSSRVLSMPHSGMGGVVLKPGERLEFSFDPSDVTFSRAGSDLVITGNHGSGLTLSGFFVAKNVDALPQFILPGGDNVPASAYLQNLNIDITTAAGPAPTAAPPSSGEGDYADGAGELLSGVDRLGSLDAAGQWSGAVKAAGLHVDAARRLGDVASHVEPDVPVPPIFNARAVLYMQNEGDAPNGEPYDGRSVTVQALAQNGNGQWGASGQAASLIQAHAGNTLDVNSLIEYAMDAGGNITFRLTAAGKDWLVANGKDMVAYYTIMDADGNPYVLQVVISADGIFNSSSEHNEDLALRGLIHGEWHDGKDLSKETDYKTTSSNLSDDLRYTGKLSGAEINTGHDADKNWGNDSVTITGEVHRSTITAGAGDDVVTITGGEVYDRSVGGEFVGAHAYGLSAAGGTRGREAGGGATVWGGIIDAGDGNNTITTSGGALYGIMDTTITTGSGNDRIDISGGSTHDTVDAFGRTLYFGGSAVKDSVINAGDGDNTITITSDYPFNPWTTNNDTIGGYSMGAVNNSKIITGSGDDSITINGATFTFSSNEVICDNALYVTTIAAGAGSDTVTINGNIDWGSTIALGNTTDRADTDQSQKNDVNVLNLNSTEVWDSAIYGTAGADIITGGSQFSQMTVATGAGSDSVNTNDVNYSTIALGNTLDKADTDAGQKNDHNILKASQILESSLFGTSGRDDIAVRSVINSTIATGAGNDKVVMGTLEGSIMALGNTTDKADTDASQKGDVNTFSVGGAGTEYRGTVVANSKVYGTAGTDLLDIHGSVNASTVDTGTGKDDKVDIWGSVYSRNASDANVIKAVEGSVSVTMKGTGTIAAVSASGANAHNTIVGNAVDITAGDTVTQATTAYGMYASATGTNLIEAGSLEIAATGIERSYAMYAKEGGINTIADNGNALTVVIKAAGGSLGNYAMFAEAHSTNQILGGAGNDAVFLKGDIHAEGAGGKNIIDTGVGDDRIVLDGKVAGNFTLDAGEGYDILVLRAASWVEFTDRYQSWLTTNFDTMHIESIQGALDNPTGSVPVWLQDLVGDYNALHTGTPIDLSPAAMTDLAHIVAGDTSNIIDHTGDVSAADTSQHTGGGHGLAAFGNGDDYVHVKGSVDHVDFTLGGGHNTLHVDGNALSDISGGNNGNDIRVGGAFGGAIDLGTGDDHVDLGALHAGSVLLGAGNDHLILSAFTGGTVNGGTGHDILTLNLGGHGGAGAFAADGAFSGLFTPGAVQNFEELHFDLSGGGSDSLELDGLIESLRGLTLGGQTSVHITGDAGSDHVDTQALSDNGWTSSADLDTGCTKWTHAGSEDENLILLIQNGLQ